LGKKDKKKSSSKPQTIWTLDTETRGLFGQIFRIGIYNGDKYWTFNTMQECYNLLLEYAKTEEIHMYIHNLDFDLAKMAGTILKDIEVKRSIFIEHNVAVFATTKDIILHDSLKLIPMSLDKICKDFGLGEASKIDLTDYLKENGYKDKGDYFNRVDPDEQMLNKYLQFDCTSLHNIIMQLIDISGLTIEEFLKCPTTASLAMKVFKENYPDDYADACSSNFRGKFGELIEEVLRQGYYGGRTEVFLPYLNGGFHYDVNSLYPYVMKVNEFPIGYYEVFQEKQAAAYYHNWKRTGKGGGFAWVKIYVPEHIHIPPLPYRAKKNKDLKGKLIFPVGRLDGVWAFPEIAMAEKYGCKIEKIEQVIYFHKTYPIFREFIEQFQELKQTSKGAKRTFAKLVQNSLYGKFGMRRLRRMIKPIEDLESVKESGKMFMEFTHPKLQTKLIQVEDTVNAQYIQPHIAAYVTAYARILLYEGLVNEHNGQVAYCDTDSIACSHEFTEDLIDDNEYGKWKLENTLKYGIFLQPKLYFEKSNDGKDTIKAKGIPGDIKKQFTESTYQIILDKIKKGEERIMFFGTEDSLFDKEVVTRGKFISNLMNGKDFDQEIKIRKGMNLRAKQKRKMDYVNNSSKPHIINDYGKIHDEEVKHEAQIAWELEVSKIDPIAEKIKEIGFIKIPDKNDFYFSEYKLISTSIKKKYFRKKGLPLDVWCTESGYEQQNFIYNLQ
jgi:hypothetical protein